MSKKIGIFGGTFNPIHNGHLSVFAQVQKRMGLDEVRVIPAFQSPLKVEEEGLDANTRLEMVEMALENADSSWGVDHREILREGPSYTVETLDAISKEDTGADLFLVIGMDQFEIFDQWKDFEKILDIAHLVVTSRPGWELCKDMDDIPASLRDLVDSMAGPVATWLSGKQVHFIELDDVDISSTWVRERARSGQSIDDSVPAPVARYIRKRKLYKPTQNKVEDFEAFTKSCAHYLFERKGIDVAGYDLRELSQPSEFTLVASGTSTRHALSMGEHMIRQIRKEFRMAPINVEGQGAGKWILVDYGALIVHIFYDFTRQEFNIEELWQEGHNMNLQDPFVGSE